MDFELPEDYKNIKDEVRKICEKELRPQVKTLDEKKKFPSEFVKLLARHGYFGSHIPTEYGGVGLGILSAVVIMEEIARVCAGTSAVYGANALGSLPILISGTEEQKKKYLSKIAGGEVLAAFALTEADAGSDALGSMKTKAVKDGDCYVLNGAKQFITNGGKADIYSVFALTNPKGGIKGISGFIVEKGMKGFVFGKNEKKVGLHCSATCSLNFDDCRVPKDNLIGGVEGIGAITVLDTLNRSRIVVGGQGVGVATGAYELAVNYARHRKQFGQPIVKFQAIQHKLADMALRIELARMLGYKAAFYSDAHANKRTIAKFGAMAKLFASETAAFVTDEAIQIFGGMGIMEETGIAKYWRDARALRIYEGTSEIQRNEIAHILIKENAKK